jgi:hypothetical protein
MAMKDVFEILLLARRISKVISGASQAPFSFPVEIQRDIHPVIKTMISKKMGHPYDVLFKQIDGKVDKVRGKLTRFDSRNYARILFFSEQTKCWRRFVMCKEMAHLITDDQDDCTTDIDAQIQGLITALPPISGIDLSIHSEYNALVLATEIMIPWELRKQIFDLKASGSTHYDLAKVCMVPEKIIDMVFSPRYSQNSTRLNTLLDNGGDPLSAS